MNNKISNKNPFLINNIKILLNFYKKLLLMIKKDLIVKCKMLELLMIGKYGLIAIMLCHDQNEQLSAFFIFDFFNTKLLCCWIL
jgi:hypothetical protein